MKWLIPVIFLAGCGPDTLKTSVGPQWLGFNPLCVLICTTNIEVVGDTRADGVDNFNEANTLTTSNTSDIGQVR